MAQNDGVCRHSRDIPSYLPCPPWAARAADGLGWFFLASAPAGWHQGSHGTRGATMVEKCIWQFILLVFCVQFYADDIAVVIRRPNMFAYKHIWPTIMFTKLSLAGWPFVFVSVLAYILFLTLGYCHSVVVVVNHRVNVSTPSWCT